MHQRFSDQSGFQASGSPPGTASSAGAGDGVKRGHPTPRIVFIGVGAMLLGTLCVVPVWNALSMLQDANYVFWAGTAVPLSMIAICAVVLAAYVLTVMAFFGYSRAHDQTEQTIMLIANIFIMLLGVALMLVSLPLSRQSMQTYQNVMRQCDHSPQTHRLFEYSQVLQNIRQSPGCREKYSVEECHGYEDAPPYTSFLKTIETDFRCSGFCYSPKAAAASTAPPAAASLAAVSAGSRAKAANASTPLTALQLKWRGKQSARHRQEGLVQPDQGSAQSVAVAQPDASDPSSRYPPTLFSDDNYQAACEGMSARDLRTFAGDIGYQSFYQGIGLVLIAVATSFLKLIGICTKRGAKFPT